MTFFVCRFQIMGRVYKKKVGARQYKNYTQATVEEAVRRIRLNQLSLQEASDAYKIPRRTLWNKLRKRHLEKPGAPTSLTEVEERHIVDVLLASAEYGSPLTSFELRLIVKRYLDKSGRIISKFRNNTPGPDWGLNFLDRHKERLTQRSCQNIKGVRAEKSEVEINAYFNRLEESLQGVPEENVLNYDETNLSDDPGQRKCIFRRGTKYPERVMNTSKSATSVMFSITANGEVLAPYVVYKAERIYDQWVIGGPPNTRYNRSKSGWFDSFCFEDWFQNIALPWARKRNGPKVIIGDNLSSHLNLNIIVACQRNNIRFIFLPPQSTHLTQPLDVGYYGPLKKCWRKILTNYKMQNPREKVVQKSSFPGLLKHLVNELKLTDTKNIQSAFRATGIVPLNRDEVLKKLPNARAEEHGISNAISETLLDYLKETRSPSTTPTQTKRKKMIRVEPGKSVVNLDEPNPSMSQDGEPIPSTSKANNIEEDSLPLVELSDLSSDESSCQSNNNLPDDYWSEEDNLPLTKVVIDPPIEVDTFVLVEFKAKKRTRHYVGQVKEIEADDYTVKFMRKQKRGFVFPQVEDIASVPKIDVLKRLEPNQINRGVHYFDVNSLTYSFY